MSRTLRSVIPRVLLVLCFFATLPTAALADSLKTITNPGGGQAVYGPLRASTLEGGLGVVLRDVHAHFGDRPQIGRLFQSKRGNSVACFFTLTAKKYGGKRIAGMVIVAMPSGARPAGAVIYDDAARFARTAGPLMGELNQAWHAAALRAASDARSAQSAPAQTYPPLPLHEVHFADNSGSIGLPDNWRLVSSGGGRAQIAGANGESIILGAIVQGIYDPRVPGARGLMQYMAMGHRQYYAYPYGGDLIQAWLALNRQYAERKNSPAPTFQETSRQPAAPSPYEGYAVLALGNFDAHDGKGLLRSRVRIGELRPTGSQWALTIERESLPARDVAREWPTVVAMLKSYRQNGQEIERQTQLVIDDIHARGRAAAARAQAQSAANDEHNASVEAGWDQSAKYNESMENYTLDRSVIENTESGEHSTLENAAADSLVRNQPNRFQYVSAPNYLRGTDY